MFRMLKNNRGQFSGGSGGGYASGTSNVSGGSSGGGVNYGAVSALTSIIGGIGDIFAARAASAISRYEAQVMEARMRLIDIAKDIENARFVRAKSKYSAGVTSSVSGRGIKQTGSVVSAEIGSLTQMTIDQAITNFNYSIEKSQAQTSVDAKRATAKTQKSQGWVNAFSRISGGMSDYALYNKKNTDEPKKQSVYRNEFRYIA